MVVSTNDLEYHNCPSCFIFYAAPAAMFNKRREDGETFYCPNGHHLSFNANEKSKLKAERDELRRERDRFKQNCESWKDEAEAEKVRRVLAEKEASSRKGVITKLKKRAVAGTCPCCHRSFRQMALHMKNQHPGYKAEEVA